MGKKVEMIGRRFGRLIVLSEDKRDSQGIIYYKCLCDCGNQKIIKGTSLRAGTTKSCGCYNREIITKINPDYKKKLYSIYRGMKNRCYNKNDKAFCNYGGRGIQISPEWDKYKKFESWAYNNGYSEGLWIDRIDNDGDYSPDNCRWTTPKKQQNNKRTCKYITINGKTQSVTEWAEETGINRSTIYRRIKLGYKGIDLIKPVNQAHSHSEQIKEYYEARRSLPGMTEAGFI